MLFTVINPQQCRYDVFYSADERVRRAYNSDEKRKARLVTRTEIASCLCQAHRWKARWKQQQKKIV